jgi:hypothetical protein
LKGSSFALIINGISQKCYHACFFYLEEKKASKVDLDKILQELNQMKKKMKEGNYVSCMINFLNSLR